MGRLQPNRMMHIDALTVPLDQATAREGVAEVVDARLSGGGRIVEGIGHSHRLWTKPLDPGVGIKPPFVRDETGRTKGGLTWEKATELRFSHRTQSGWPVSDAFARETHG
jgi:hypothetical protein